MNGIDWTQVLVAFVGPLFAFMGIIAQCYFAKRSKKDKNDQTAKLEKVLEENKKITLDNKHLVEKNCKIINELKKQLSANDIVTVSVVRQNIRRMYYELLPHKVISLVDYRALNEMYNAYKAVTLPDGHHPNSWCDALYKEMSEWEKVEAYPAHLSYLNAPINKERKKEKNGRDVNSK